MNVSRKQQQLQPCKSFHFQRTFFLALDLSKSQIPHSQVHHSARVEPEKKWYTIFMKIICIFNIGLGENADFSFAIYTIMVESTMKV